MVVGWIVVMVANYGKNNGINFLTFGVLVGAFSIFGLLDTGNPVQNSGVFRKLTLILFPEGLI